MAIFGGIFLFCAIIFTGVFITLVGVMGNMQDKAREELDEFTEHAIKTVGEITDVDGVTIVEYYSEIDESYHKSSFPVSNSSFREGDSVVIYYDENHPGSCMAPDLVEATYETLGTVYFGVAAGLGIFFGVIGLVLLIGGVILIKKSKTSNAN